jgi:membrane-associated phospholipid phosphatase
MDKIIFLWLHQLIGQSWWFDQVILFLSQYLPYLVVLAIFILCLWSFNRRLIGLLWFDLIFLAAGIAWFLAGLLKYNLVTPRPFLVWSNLHPLFLSGGLESFPSGHAVFFGALAGGVLVLNRRAGYLALALAALIGLARVIAGVHWPSDVVAGLIFGTLAGYWQVWLVAQAKAGVE